MLFVYLFKQNDVVFCVFFMYVFTQHLFHEQDVSQGQFLSRV